MVPLAPYRRSLLALYTIGLLVVTLAPLPSAAYGAVQAPGADKAVHLLLFGAFAALLHWNLDGRRRIGAFPVVGLSGAFAALIELAQWPLPFRSGDIWDLGWGVVGAVAGYGAARVMLRGSRSRVRGGG